MALIDTYRKNVSRKRKELSDLQTQKARVSKNISNLEGKINSDKHRISRTKSESIIKTKQQNIERNNNKLSTSYQKLAKIEQRIGKKSRELENEKKKLQDRNRKEEKKTLRLEEKYQKELQKNMNDVEKSLNRHEVLHQQTQEVISNLKNVPEKIKILFITSSPADQTRLSPDEEVREIEDKLRKSDYRDSISFVTRWAARPLDVLQAINEIKPTIIHFSGHGSDDSELVFQDDDGYTKLVSKEAIVQTIATATEDVKMVFFSSCFTHQQAEEIVKHVDAAIGMINEIGDDSARIFATYFYASIGFGHSISKAFGQAKVALMLEGILEEDVPALYVKKGLESEEIVLVKP